MAHVITENSTILDNGTLAEIDENLKNSNPLLPDVSIHQFSEYIHTTIFMFLILFFLLVSVWAIGQWNIVTFVWCGLVTGLWIPILMYCGIKIGVDLCKNSTCYSNCINVNNTRSRSEKDIEMNNLEIV